MALTPILTHIFSAKQSILILENYEIWIKQIQAQIDLLERDIKAYKNEARSGTGLKIL